MRMVALGLQAPDTLRSTRHSQKRVIDALGVHFTLQWPLRVRQPPQAQFTGRHLSSAGPVYLPGLRPLGKDGAQMAHLWATLSACFPCIPLLAL